MPFPQRHFEEGPRERRETLALSEEQIDEIAEAAATKAMAKLEAKMYQEVGKAFVNKFMVLIGTMTAGVYFMGVARGWWK